MKKPPTAVTAATVNLTYKGTPVALQLADGNLNAIEQVINDACTRDGWSVAGTTPVTRKQARPRTSAAVPVQPTMPALAPRLSHAEWLHKVNNCPNEAPHVSIFGPSGSGKTSLAQTLLAKRHGQFVVIDPKPALPGTQKWGLPYTMIGDDGEYTAIDAQLQAIRAEVNRRLAAMKRGEPAYTPLTVVIDEYKTVRRVCPESASDVYITLSDIGRELNMRLIILSTSRGVESLGIKGMGDTKDSHIIIEVDKQHRAALEWDGTTYQIDTSTRRTAKRRALHPSRWWNPQPALVEETTVTLTLEKRTRRIRAEV